MTHEFEIDEESIPIAHVPDYLLNDYDSSEESLHLFGYESDDGIFDNEEILASVFSTENSEYYIAHDLVQEDFDMSSYTGVPSQENIPDTLCSDDEDMVLKIDGDDSQSSFSPEKIPSLFFDKYHAFNTPIRLAPGEQFITVKEKLKEFDYCLVSPDSAQPKETDNNNNNKAKGNEKKRKRTSVQILSDEERKKQNFCKATGLKVLPECLDRLRFSVQERAKGIAHIVALGHSSPPLILNDKGDISKCGNKRCVVCEHSIGNCESGICKIPAGECDAKKHIICITCFWLCSLLSKNSFNGYTFCPCPGCGDNGNTKIKVDNGYSQLCGIFTSISPPSTEMMDLTTQRLIEAKGRRL